MSGPHIQALVIKGRTALPYAPVTIKTDAGRGALTVLAERQSEFPGVTQQPVSIRAYPVRRDGRAGARLRRAGLRRRAQAARVRRRQAGHGRRPGRPRVLLRPLPARPAGDRARGGQRGGLSGAEQPRADAAEGRLQPQGDARPGPAAARAKKRCCRASKTRAPGGKPADAGAFVALDPRNGQVLAMGSSPTFDPNKFAKPLTKSEYAALEGKAGASGEERAGAADRPRRQRHLPDGLDVQADHRDGHAGSGRDQPHRGPRRGPVHPRLDRAVLQRRQGRLRRRRAGRSAEGLLRHVLLRSRRAGQQPRQRDPARGAQARRGRADGDRPAERDHRPGARPRVAREGRPRGARVRAAHATCPAAASPTGARGASATTCTWRSGRATC